MTLLTRTITAEIEIRDDGRTLDVLAVPYDRATRVGGIVETFTRGSFPDAVADPSKVKLLAGHDHQGLPLGRAVTVVDDPAGLRASFHVSATQAGDDALTLVRDGALTAVSIGFIPEPSGDRWNTSRTQVVRTRARLVEVSLVAVGAYPDAQVLALRQDSSSSAPRLALARWR